MSQRKMPVMFQKALRGLSRNKWRSPGCFIGAALLLVTTLSPTFVQGENPNDILIIANMGVKISGITVEELKEIYLKKRANWTMAGDKAIPIHVADNAALREEFRARVLKMNSTEEESYWRGRKVKAGESEPPVLGNVLKAVFKLRGSVSYIYRSQYRQGVVKVILVLPRR
jgi:hypothetical protein